MKVVRCLQHGLPVPTVVSVGNFDGFHRGHQSILAQLKHLSQQHDLAAAIVFFEPQPREFFGNPPSRLMSAGQKLRYLSEIGIDYAICLRFDQQLANVPAQDFFEQQICEKWHAQHLLVGEDFRFGKHREGTVSHLKRWCDASNTQLHMAKPIYEIDRRVSSTWVREALAQSNFDLAQKLLSRFYSISGRVVYGKGLARQWGVPTANIPLTHCHHLPLKGVFLVKAQIVPSRLWRFGIANIGVRPTVNGLMPMLEVHFFDYESSLYGKRLNVCFLHKLRDEQRFSSLELLAAQIRRDVLCAKQYLQEGV